MLKLLRYTLAAICLTASAGCLALWGLDIHGWANKDRYYLEIDRGSCTVWYNSWGPEELPLGDADRPRAFGAFAGLHISEIYFPIWYPALAFALAAVAAIRIGRQFTLRSALVGMSVVAALLGMVVAL